MERQSASSYQAGNTGYQYSQSQEQHTYTTGSTVRESRISSHGSAHGSRLGSRRSSSSSSSDEEARRSASHTSTTYTSGYSGGMSLHELNNRLERYIQQIQLNPGDPHVSINVDRISEGGSFDIHSMPQYHEYERLLKEYTEQEEELARVEAEITILTQDNSDYRDRLSNLEEKLRLKKIEISNMEMEIKKFETSRRSAESALIDTKQHNARVSVKQEQARFIDSLSSLQFESVTTTEEMVDEDKVRNEIKEEYNKRLEIEKEKIRHLYKSYERDMTQSIKSIFDAKIKELQKLKAHWSKEQVAEVDDILARLEHAKKTIIDLEKKKLDLTQEERRLKELYDEEELKYKTTLDAKRKEADYLKEEYSKLQLEYSRFETDRSGYFREVERYGTILKGVHPVNVSVHAEKFYDKNLEPARDDTSSSSSDGEGNDEYQRRKQSTYQSTIMH